MSRDNLENTLIILAIALIALMLFAINTTKNLPRVEVCDNGVDDNRDGRVDCADSHCIETWPGCHPYPFCDEIVGPGDCVPKTK